MPRPVKVRITYQADVTYLSRLMTAIEKDDKLTDAWKRLIKRKIGDVILLLMNVKNKESTHG